MLAPGTATAVLKRGIGGAAADVPTQLHVRSGGLNEGCAVAVAEMKNREPCFPRFASSILIARLRNLIQL